MLPDHAECHAQVALKEKMLDSRFELLFEPVKIGPVTAPNRFYQVPHCTGMGYALPQTLATMRGVKAEGGWGVVNTEYCSIHPTSDDMPYPFASLWDEADVRSHAKMTDLVHKHGSLAGVELWHGGARSSNMHSREVPMSAKSIPVANSPWQTKRMDKDDVRDLRRWHRDAALRARRANFDIVYAYATHNYLMAQFLNPLMNDRADEYGLPDGGDRLLIEILEETKDAIGERCAIALRIDVGTLEGRERRNELLAKISPLVDLFDMTVPEYSGEMGASRFQKEAALEEHVAHIRALTGKPVVSVGRFTSPETMLSQVKRGVLDFIGAARPSIADPFLPAKIREGRFDDIRECIGCNICYAHDGLGVPIRCTQNPTMGEEWRRDWHPERVPKTAEDGPVLVIGGGPAGLEAAVTLGKRGIDVILVEATRHLGGRVNLESRLPGLSEWSRVRDWRVGQIEKMDNVQVFRGSVMDAEAVRELGVERVIVATGSRWRVDGVGRSFPAGVSSFENQITLSVEKAAGFSEGGRQIVIFDDDHYYMGTTLAESMARLGNKVLLVTPQGRAGNWSAHTAEQNNVQKRLLSLGVRIEANSTVSDIRSGTATLECVFSGARHKIDCDVFVPVTSREPIEQLWTELKSMELRSLHRVGDCNAPGIIAQAIYDGHRVAREFGHGQLPQARRERAFV